MKALVISDIHGNLAALQAVLALPHDIVVCLGDIVGYGPDPAECTAIVMREGTLCVQGNHDLALGAGVAPNASARFQALAALTTPLAQVQLDETARTYLRTLPHWGFIRLGTAQFMGMHATPRDPLYEYLGPNAAAWGERVRGLAADVVLVGHTHLQFALEVEGRRIVNPGSVGQPKDGDPRAACAVIDDEGGVSLRRVAYDVEATVAALTRAPIPERAASELAALLRTGRPDRMDAPTAPGTHASAPA